MAAKKKKSDKKKAEEARKRYEEIWYPKGRPKEKKMSVWNVIVSDVDTYAKSVSKQKGKKGCAPGMRKVTKNGKSYCTPAKGSRKGRDY